MRENRINIALHAFLAGMLLEYLVKIEVSTIPLVLFILISINLILDFIPFKNKTLVKKLNGVNTVEVINDGCFYKKGMILHRYPDGRFAPNVDDYPKHCRFLTEDFIISKPKIFKIIQE
jgi:hypothetical protein